LTLSIAGRLFFVKRKDDKQWKGSKERRKNNREGQKKRGQTTERVKRKDDQQWKGSKEETTNNGKGQRKGEQTIERDKRKLFSVDPFH
jgi:hypothetical protein